MKLRHAVIDSVRSAETPLSEHHGTEVLTRAELWRMLVEAE
jgi:hypothetical protein